MMMAAISFAGPSVAPADAAPAPQPMSDKGQGFDAAFADAAQPAVKDGDAPRSPVKDKDRRADKPKDEGGDGAPAPVAPLVAQASPSEPRAPGKADDKGRAPRATVDPAGSTPAETAAASGEPAVDGMATPLDPAHLAPVLDALKQLASAQQQAPVAAPPADQARPIETPQAAAHPLPATASLLAARIVPAAMQQPDAKPVSPKKAARAEATDRAPSTDATGSSLAPSSPDPASASRQDAASGQQPDAGQQLAAGSADRALDMAKQGAWLDGLARDIAATGSASSTLRFEAAPTHLGPVQVEIARGLEGAAVTLTASSEASRATLNEAKPQLVAEARAQGIHIASAQVDVSADSRQQGTGSQPDRQHDPRGDTGFSSHPGGGGQRGGQGQTRSQPFAITQPDERQPAAGIATDEPAAPAGGMYA